MNLFLKTITDGEQCEAAYNISMAIAGGDMQVIGYTSTSGMKPLILFLFFLIITALSFGQPRIVKLTIDNQTVYINFFYKIPKSTKQTLSDSIYLLCQKITEDKFYLDYFKNKKGIWRKIYRIEEAQDSLPVTTMARAADGKYKLIHSKELYYKGVLIKD